MDSKEIPVNDDIPVLAIEQNLPVSLFRTEDDNFVCSVFKEEVHQQRATPIALADKATSNASQPRPYKNSLTNKRWMNILKRLSPRWHSRLAL